MGNKEGGSKELGRRVENWKRFHKKNMNACKSFIKHLCNYIKHPWVKTDAKLPMITKENERKKGKEKGRKKESEQQKYAGLKQFKENNNRENS